jgi:hypothetical protein
VRSVQPAVMFLPRSRASSRRLWLLTIQALREAAHLRLAWAVAAVALTLTGAAGLLRQFNFGATEARFLCDLAEGTLMLFGVGLAIALPVALLHLRPARDTVGLLQMHGVRRHEWLLSRAMASWVTLLWLGFTVQVIVAVLLWRCGQSVPPSTLVAAGATSVLRLAVVASVAVAMGSLCHSPLLAAILTLALTVAAQLSPVIAWAQERSETAASVLLRAVDWALPDFQAMGVSGQPALYSAGYVALCMTLGCWIFSRREL